MASSCLSAAPAWCSSELASIREWQCAPRSVPARARTGRDTPIINVLRAPPRSAIAGCGGGCCAIVLIKPLKVWHARFGSASLQYSVCLVLVVGCWLLVPEQGCRRRIQVTEYTHHTPVRCAPRLPSSSSPEYTTFIIIHIHEIGRSVGRTIAILLSLSLFFLRSRSPFVF